MSKPTQAELDALMARIEANQARDLEEIYQKTQTSVDAALAQARAVLNKKGGAKKPAAKKPAAKKPAAKKPAAKKPAAKKPVAKK